MSRDLNSFYSLFPKKFYTLGLLLFFFKISFGASFFKQKLLNLQQEIKLELSEKAAILPSFQNPQQESFVTLLAPNLLLDASVDNMTPSTSEEFCYKIRYRCASITEHCENAQISFELHPSMRITEVPGAVGNISNVTQAGNMLTFDLESPPSAGVPDGVLAAGSAGILKVCAVFECVDDAAPTVGGDMVNFVSDPTFTATGASTMATASDVTVPALSDCPVVLPPSPPNAFEKNSNDYSDYRYAMPGSFGGWEFDIPPATPTFTIVDDFPPGFRLSDFDGLDPGYILEVDCGGGYQILATGWDSSLDDLRANILNPNSLDSGDFILDTLGNPTDCIVQYWVGVDGSEAGYISNSTSLRLTVPSNDTDGASYDFEFYIDEDVPCGTYQNIATTSISATFPTSGDDMEIYCTGYDIHVGSDCTEQIGNALTDNSDFDLVNPFFTVDPLDLQFRIQIMNKNLATQDVTQGFVVEALLDEELSFITDFDNPNYWAIHQSPSQVQYLPECENPTFEIIPNHTGAQTLLKWTFPPSCILEAGYTDNFTSNSGGDTRFPEIYFSLRYNLTAPIPGSLGIDVTAYLSDNALFGPNRTSVSASRNCSTPNGSSVNSAKYVQGALDNEFHRYPFFGNTNLTGEGDFELFMFQSGFDNITDVHLVDILPYIGDVDLLLPSISRGSEWSMELSQDITVERYKIGTGLVDATANLGANGVYYSNSNNPCYLTGLSDVEVPTGMTGTHPSCNIFTAGGTAAGARSWGFHWSNAGDPLVFGEYLKITMRGVQLTGEADMTDLEIAWNSFAFSTTNSDNDILTSQPIKVGLKMVDESAFSSIGSRVWKDANANGVQDEGELGIGGVTVSLYHPDGMPVEDTTFIGAVTTTIPRTSVTTDSLGEYCFTGLPANTNYIVRIDSERDYVGSSPLANLTLTSAGAGSDAALDSDGNVGDGGGLFANQYPEILTASSTNAGIKNDSLDFGFYQLGLICGHAFEDTDEEGDEDDDERDLENIIISAYDLSGALATTTTTNALGYYTLELPPGTYNLSIDITAFPGFVFTASNATGDDTNDSDVSSDGFIRSITLAECGDTNCDQDIGLVAPPANPATLEGIVWDELGAKNGVRDVNEPILENVTVQLLDADGFVINSTVTDDMGAYQFSNLTPDITYSIQFIPPNTATFFTSAGADMDADVNGTTTAMTPTTNETISNIDAGLCGLYSLGNLVFHDANNDGFFNNGEGIFPNIKVYLIDGTDGTTYLDSTTTDANGKYVFTNLNTGDYIVEVAVPYGGYQSSTDIGSSSLTNNLDSDDNGIGIARTGRVRSNVLTIQNTGGTFGDANWTETDHGEAINGRIDNTSNPKAYYTADFGFWLCNIPEVTAFAIQASCTNGSADDNAYLQLSEATNGTHYNFSMGSTYVGSTDIAAATAFTATTDLPLKFGSLDNPTGSQDYTIRVFSEESDCFTDVTVTLNEQDCTVGCDCDEYLYLNETTNGGRIHKFEITPGGGSLMPNEIGNPWFDNAALGETLTNPHGLGTDLNGFLYIGESDGGDIRQLNCDGEITPATDFEIEVGGIWNSGSIGNTLYANNALYDGSPDGIYAYDLCTEATLGYICLEGLDGINASAPYADWGFYIDEDGTGYVTDSYFDDFHTDAQNNLWVFDVETATLNAVGAASPTCIAPFLTEGDGTLVLGESELPSESIWGVTTDSNDNIYIVVQTGSDGSGTDGHARILKYNSAGTLIAMSPWDTTEGTTYPGTNPATGMAYTADDRGFFRAIGITHSTTTDLLYVSTTSPLDDCVAMFDTDLNYLGAAIPFTNNNTLAKGISKLKECCPTNNNITIDTALCFSAVNEQIFLQELVGCEGIICEGMWEEGMGNTGLTYNSCDNSVTINAPSACGTFTLESDGLGNNPQCGAFVFTVNITVSSLDLTVTQNNCTDNLDGTFTANYDVTVDWNSVPCEVGEMINVTHNGISIGTIDPVSDTSPSTFSLDIEANGAGTNTIHAAYTFASCADSTYFKTPVPCINDVTACTSTAGCIGGNVFEDYNCNGIENVSEPGVQGVEIQIYDCANTLIGTTYSDSDGDWQVCSLNDGDAYRVEFILPEAIACWATPTHVSGSGNQSDVQFLTAPDCTQFSVSSPHDYCQENPYLSIPCFINGDPLVGGTAANEDAIVSFLYNDETDGSTPVPPSLKHDAETDEVGAVWGAAFHTSTQQLFTTAFLKRHAGWGPQGIGGIYITDYAAATPTTTNFIDLTALGVNLLPPGAPTALLTNGAGGRNLPADKENPSNDPIAFDYVGKAGMGAVQFSEDGNTLFIINLAEQNIVSIDMSDYFLNGTSPTAAQLSMLTIPLPTCNNGVARPMALKQYRGKLYVGVTCTGENGGTAADINISVLAYDIASDSWATALDTYTMDYVKGPVDQNHPSECNTWSIWTTDDSDYTDLEPAATEIRSCRPAPSLSGIELDESGNMILGIMDISGHQWSYLNYDKTSTSDRFDWRIGGSILKAADCSNTGLWTIESNGGLCGSAGSVNQQNGEGPGGGEFFYEDNMGENITVHREVSMGTVMIKKGTNQVVMTAMDPIGIFSGGMMFLNNVNGSTDKRSRIYSTGFLNNNGTAGKANGLGMPVAICNPTPLEIGNYVWCDSLENGIQDACERGIDDIIVQLYDRNGNLVGQDTTSNSGQYYFNENNVDTTGITVDGAGMATPTTSWSGMSYSTQYFIAFGDGQFSTTEFTVGGNVYGITPMTNTGANDNIDSDVDGNNLSTALIDLPAGLPFIDLTTSATGCGDHKYDLGLTCVCDISITANTQTTCFDNGTSSDDSDDYFTLTVNASEILGGAQYQVVIGANPDGTGGTVLGTSNYNATITVGDGINGATNTFLADGTSAVTVTIRDANNNTCHDEFVTTPVNSCSNECVLTITANTQTTCNDNGTTSNATDDYFTLMVNANSVNGGAQYQVVLGANPDGTGGTILGSSNYGTPITVGDGTNAATGTFVADGSTTYDVTVRDATTNTCHDEFTTSFVNSCSNECVLTITANTQTTCFDNGTTSNDSDDYFTLMVNATSVNGGAQYQVVLGANPDGTGGTILGSSNYGTPITVGDGINAATGTFVADGSTTYDVTVRDATTNTCHDEFTTSFVNSCNSFTCPTITNPTADVTICEGQTITTLSVDTDAMTPTAIDFVYFTTQQTGENMYSGGTSVGVVEAMSGTASVSDISLATPTTYYFYAILNPTPAEGTCRPFQEIEVTINPNPDLTLTVSDPEICDGDDAEIIVSNSEIGVNYQLRLNSNDSNVGSAITGTGGDITFTVSGLSSATGTYEYNMFATNNSTGCNGELSDLSRVIVNNCDMPTFFFPQPFCPTTPCHVIDPNIQLGAANMMNDGVVFPNNIRPNITIRVPITIVNNTGNPSYLTGWIDWNGDNDFDDTGEQIADETYLPGTYSGTFTISLPISVPSNANLTDQIGARFRVSTDNVSISSPCGSMSCAADGEVEDYLIQVECPPGICLPLQIQINRE